MCNTRAEVKLWSSLMDLSIFNVKYIDLRMCMYKHDRCKRLKIFIRLVLFIGSSGRRSRQWEIYRLRYPLLILCVCLRVCVFMYVWYISWFRGGRQWFDNGSKLRFMARIIEERKTVWNIHALANTRVLYTSIYRRYSIVRNCIIIYWIYWDLSEIWKSGQF